MRCSHFPERTHQQQLEERCRENTPRNDAALCLQRLSCNAIELHVPGRLIELEQQLQASPESACALLRRSAFGTPHDQRLSAGHRGWLLPRARPPLPIFTPCFLVPDTPLNATRLRGPEEAFCIPGLPHVCLGSPKHALRTHDGEQQPNGSHASRRLRNEGDPIAQGGPFAFLFNEHDEIDQGLVQRPWRNRIVPKPSDRTKGREHPVHRAH